MVRGLPLSLFHSTRFALVATSWVGRHRSLAPACWNWRAGRTLALNSTALRFSSGLVSLMHLRTHLVWVSLNRLDRFPVSLAAARHHPGALACAAHRCSRFCLSLFSLRLDNSLHGHRVGAYNAKRSPYASFWTHSWTYWRGCWTLRHLMVVHSAGLTRSGCVLLDGTIASGLLRANLLE